VISVVSYQSKCIWS